MVGTTAALIGGAISIIGGVVANEAARGGRDAAGRAAQSAFDAINQLQIPDIEKQKLLLEMPQVMGQYFPEQEVAQALEGTQMSGITTDPRLAEAQMKQLESLTQLGETGFTPETEAELNALRRDVARGDQSRQAGIIQNLAQRGVGGSGIELAQRLASSQGAAQQQAEEADRQAAMAFRNQLEAMAGAGGLATNLRGQEFGEKSQVAKAEDEIARFNLSNNQAVQQRNIAAKNEAQLRNLQEKQRIADQQTNLRNQQEQHNKQLIQQEFNNQYQKQAALAGQYGNVANQQMQQANQQAGMIKDIGTGAGAIVGALGQKQPELPKDANDYLDALKRGTGQ